MRSKPVKLKAGKRYSIRCDFSTGAQQPCRQRRTNREGRYEISVPLSVLHWQPKPGAIYRADIGLLRGANGQTTQRVY